MRGEILLDPGLLGKEGGRYQYPYSLIELQASLHARLMLPYR